MVFLQWQGLLLFTSDAKIAWKPVESGREQSKAHRACDARLQDTVPANVDGCRAKVESKQTAVIARCGS